MIFLIFMVSLIVRTTIVRKDRFQQKKKAWDYMCKVHHEKDQQYIFPFLWWATRPISHCVCRLVGRSHIRHLHFVTNLCILALFIYLNVKIFCDTRNESSCILNSFLCWFMWIIGFLCFICSWLCWRNELKALKHIVYVTPTLQQYIPLKDFQNGNTIF